MEERAGGMVETPETPEPYRRLRWLLPRWLLPRWLLPRALLPLPMARLGEMRRCAGSSGPSSTLSVPPESTDWDRLEGRLHGAIEGPIGPKPALLPP